MATTIPRWLMAAFALVFLVLLGGGAWFYRAQEQRMRAGAEANLEAVAQLKVTQIARWRAERLADLTEIMERPFTQEAVARWMTNPEHEGSDRVFTWFRSLQKHHHLHDVLLVDARGEPRLSLSGRTGPLHSEAMEALATALRERRCMLTDLHVGPGDLPPHVDAIVPVFAPNGQTGPIGGVVQQIDARQFLYPLIQSWPTPSQSPETLLVRRDGDVVLFLNDLRFQKDTALKLRIPLSQKEVPAVMAVLGKQGVVEGKDYRGIEVLSVLKAVPDTPWFMVAKIDKNEILANWRFLSMLIPLMILGLVAVVAATMGMAWQRYAKAHYRALYQSEVARSTSEARFEATLMGIGDGVIATDAEGRVELLNPVAEALTGWRQEEAHGRDVADVFRIVNQETRHQVENAVARVLREGTVIGLANHTVLIARDGREFPIADSGAPIRNEKGEIIGVVLVFRDQTDELTVLKALQESEQKYRGLYDEAPVGYVELDSGGRIVKVNRSELEMLGYTEEEMLGQPVWKFVMEEDAQESVMRKIAGERSPSKSRDRTFRRKNGTPLPVLVDDKIVSGSKGRITGIRATMRDDTQRRRAEDLLRESEARFSSIFHASPVAIAITRLKDGVLIDVNKAWQKVTGFSREEAVGHTPIELNSWADPVERDRLIRALREQGKVRDFEFQVRHKSGSLAYMLMSAESIELVGERYMLSLAQDITERKRAEAALKHAEQRYRKLFEEAPVMYVTTRNEGGAPIITDCNELFLTTLGYARDELVLKPLADLYAPASRVQLIEGGGYERALAGNFQAAERSLLTREGRTIDTLLRAMPESDSQGHVYGTRAMFVDITEQTQAEKSLREIQGRLSSIVRTSPLAIIVTDTEGRVTLWNEAAEHIFGWKEEEVLHQPTPIVPEDRLEEIRQVRSRVLKGETLTNTESVRQRKDGSRIPVSFSVTALRCSKDEPVEILGIVADITDRKRAKEALKESEEQYRQVIEQINEVLFSLDQNGIITFISPVVRAVAGYEPEDLIGHPFTDFIHPDDLPALVNEFNAFMKGKRDPIECRVRAKSGETVWVRSSAKALFEGGEFKGIKGVLTDITEQRKAREAAGKLEEQLRQAQKMEAIGTLASGVAHDFNNLLTVILGNTDLMLGDVREDHPFFRPLEETRKAASRAASLTRQLLAFSRREVIEPKILDLNEIIHHAQKMLGRLIGENIRLETNLAPDLWPIEADSNQVEQIIMNLAVNARDAMPEGGHLAFRTQNSEVDEAFFKEKGITEGPGSYAVLRVTDTGMGMSPDVIERIFEPFFTTKGAGKGTGLGLSTVYGIVKQNKGYIFVQSAPGAGTTFEILLPKAEGKRSDEAGEVSPQAKSLGSETILVVEDNEDVRAVAVETLRRHGYRVLDTPDGQSALNLIRSDKGPIHLLITDVIMPGMGGNQLADHVRALSPATKVLFMSGYPDDSISHQGVLKPGLVLLRKPFSPDALARKVREVLDSKGETEA